MESKQKSKSKQEGTESRKSVKENTSRKRKHEELEQDEQELNEHREERKSRGRPSKSKERGEKSAKKSLTRGSERKSSKKQGHPIKLYYTNNFGRVEASRMLLHHAHVDFDDIRLSRQELDDMKADGFFEFNQIPVLEFEGEKYAQSMAILRLLGKQYGYYPDDPFLSGKIDAYIDAGQDWFEKYWTNIFGNEEDQRKFFEETCPFYFERFQKRLLNNSTQKYIHGDKMSIADFYSASIAFAYIWNEDNEHHKKFQAALKPYQELRKYYLGLKDELGDYLDKRPKGIDW